MACFAREPAEVLNGLFKVYLDNAVNSLLICPYAFRLQKNDGPEQKREA